MSRPNISLACRTNDRISPKRRAGTLTRLGSKSSRTEPTPGPCHATGPHDLIRAMRLMLIDDDPRYRTLLRHHISCAWQDVELVSYNPRVRGPLTPGFLAQGYSVVLLDHEWKGGSGLDWLRD